MEYTLDRLLSSVIKQDLDTRKTEQVYKNKNKKQ